MSASNRQVLSILFDENVNRKIIRGLESRLADLDAVTVQQVGLGGMPDPQILEWAAINHRILVTHDLRTMPRHAGDRVRAGQEMPGVFAVPKSLPIGEAIEELVLLLECSLENEWESRVIYLPS